PSGRLFVVQRAKALLCRLRGNDGLERNLNPVERASDLGHLWGIGVFGQTKTLACRRPAPTGKEELA
ncbi:hypothetical protein, partial [Oleiphilus sp. HI0125]|uniref:hypothetical protein n=1 Tax=Oleiphilus sp. HI0125 TaxID=1822266 RepID=UPI000AA94E7C